MERKSGLAKLKNLYKRYHYERLVLRAFFHWALKHTEEKTTVSVRMDTVGGTFLRRGFSFVRAKQEALYTKTWSNFSLYTPRMQESPDATEGDRAARRVSLFESDFVCVDEHVSHGRGRLLRHGLSLEEKKLALAMVRQNIGSFLETGKRVVSLREGESIPSVFQEPATVDVVVWVRGEIRGSIIFSAPSLTEALLEGSARSVRDSRFRPLHYSELDETCLEINVLSGLHLPLPGVGFFNAIATEKGYCARWQNKVGWYLPSVFNVTRFSGAADFLSRLAVEKARIKTEDMKFVSFSFFEVETFVEHTGDAGVVEMRGPLVKRLFRAINRENVKAVASEMADWVCRVQDPHGHLPQHIDPYIPAVSRRADWPRMAFAAFALGVYGEELNALKYLEAGDRTAGFITTVLNDLSLLAPGDCAITHAYLGRLALVRGRGEEARLHADAAQKFLLKTPFSPVVFLQAASLFNELDGQQGVTDRGRTEKMVLEAMCEWESLLARGREVSFAGFAELMPLLFALAGTGHSQAREFGEQYKKVRAWYGSHQNRDGSFPNTTYSAFTYTRGTGKIFEALAVDKENIGPCMRSFRWVSQFCYSEDSLFCVPRTFRERMRGSLMHDDLNHAAWIDSPGHILVGVARLLHHATPAEIAAFFETESA